MAMSKNTPIPIKRHKVYQLTSGTLTLTENVNFKSNQIIFIGLWSSKDYYKRPGGGVGIWDGSLGCEFLRGSMCAEGMGLWEEVG